MGISDSWDRISIVEAIHDSLRTKFSITNQDIKLLHLDDLLKNNKTADDDFKVTFFLHMLVTVLAPAAGEYVDVKYLNVLTDVSINEYTPPSAHGDNSDKEKADISNDDRIHLERRTTIAKGHDEQSSTCRIVVKKTGTSKMRKPSQYRLSPYQSSHQIQQSSMFWYGPFHLSISLNGLDAETIVSTTRILINRSSFCTLKPKVWVDSEYPSLTSKDGNMKKLGEIHSTFKADYMYDLHRCHMMMSLDNVLATKMKSCFGPSFSFQTFSLVCPKDVPTQPNFYDYGIYMCMFINERSNATSRKFLNAVIGCGGATMVA
ncbi:hypothetical protein Ddye_019894 [Dipteronia dyeriana]|uniref:Ubiquitin-like protease family profile domain-containing protein n=1 Tax=Dipteronia dyeriana TaxID=168575 RepID=A0AAD9WUV4_9ROSI|nr:hypothetical protein Ddye_019894 [Dipteronia dyeriana]